LRRSSGPCELFSRDFPGKRSRQVQESSDVDTGRVSSTRQSSQKTGVGPPPERTVSVRRPIRVSGAGEPEVSCGSSGGGLGLNVIRAQRMMGLVIGLQGEADRPVLIGPLPHRGHTGRAALQREKGALNARFRSSILREEGGGPGSVEDFQCGGLSSPGQGLPVLRLLSLGICDLEA